MKDVSTPKQRYAYEMYQKAIELVRYQSALILDIGSTYKIIRDQKLYRYMGDGGFDNFEQFLSQPEINLAVPTIRAYIYVYEIYIQKLGMVKEEVAQIPFYKLQALASTIKDKEKEKAIEMLGSFKELGARDFRDELAVIKGVDTSKPSRSIKRATEFDDLLVQFLFDIGVNQEKNKGRIEKFKSDVKNWFNNYSD